MKTTATTAAIAKELKGLAKTGVYVGRFNPMHLGHQAMMGSIMEAFGDKHLILIGSCNHPISIRHLFNYKDRTEFIRLVYPQARIVGLPDFEGDDSTWFQALDDIISVSGADPKNTVFIGGSREDVEFYYENGRNVHIINRYDGPTVKVSGSEIRDALIGKRTASLRKVLDPRLIKPVSERFEIRWNEVRQK
jgi:FAD synthase